MKWLFPEHVGERTLCRSPDSSGGAGVAQPLAVGRPTATPQESPGLGPVAWLQGGAVIRSPMRFRPGENCRICGSFSWLLPFSGLVGRAVVCCRLLLLARALGLPGAVGLLGGWRGGIWGWGSVVRPPGADWSHHSQSSASCSPNRFIPSSVRQTKLSSTRRVFGPLARDAGSRACVEDF